MKRRNFMTTGLSALAGIFITEKTSFAGQSTTHDKAEPITQIARDAPMTIQFVPPRMTLNEPADHWTDGHILGNGDVGAVVWGSAEAVRIGLSKHDAHELYSTMPHGNRWNMKYPEIRERVMKGERKFLWDIGNLEKYRIGSRIPLACGRLTLGLLRGIQPHGFLQELDLATAECVVTATPTTVAQTWGVSFAPVIASVFVPANENIVIVELKSAQQWTIGWNYDLNCGAGRIAPEFSTVETPTGIAGVMFDPIPTGIGYAVAVACAAPSFLAHSSPSGLSGQITFGGDAGSVVIVVGMASVRDTLSASPVRMAVELAGSWVEQPLASLRTGHRKWWEDFWARSAISYENKNIERLWYTGIYALGASTRPDKTPPHLQGIWNQDDVPAWRSDFHFNTNIQMCQWAACPSNHPEQEAALIRVLIKDWREELRLYAREMFDVEGVAIPLNTDFAGKAIGGVMGGGMSLTAWTAQHLWNYWRHTMDIQVLRRDIYPWLCEACQLYMAILVRDNHGLYNIEVSHSPEQMYWDADGKRWSTYGRNPAIDVACISYLFNAVLKAAEYLKINDDFVSRCRDVAGNLPRLPSKGGVLIDYETGFFPDGDRPGHLPLCHRHPSRLMAIWPAGLINLASDPEMLELGTKSFQEFQSYGFDCITGWSLAYQCCIAARLGMSFEAEDCLVRLLRAYMLRGGLTSHNSCVPGDGNYASLGGPLFQIEALLGSAAGINEMLMHSVDDVIYVFPAIPLYRSAAFRTLRAPGGLLVSADKDGATVRWIEILSERNGLIRLSNPWHKALITAKEEHKRILTGTVIEWMGRVGTKYLVETAEK